MNTLAMSPALPVVVVENAGRALLLRAGQSLWSHAPARRPAGRQTEREPHSSPSRKRSIAAPTRSTNAANWLAW